MKSLELSAEHQVKLLEMCKVLFPEYIDIQIVESDFDENILKIIFLTKESFKAIIEFDTEFPNEDFDFNLEDVSFDEYDISIHWFEFVMSHLVEKILNPTPELPARGLSDKFKTFFWETNLFMMTNNDHGQHPVDYLYERFKIN